MSQGPWELHHLFDCQPRVLNGSRPERRHIWSSAPYNHLLPNVSETAVNITTALWSGTGNYNIFLQVRNLPEKNIAAVNESIFALCVYVVTCTEWSNEEIYTQFPYHNRIYHDCNYDTIYVELQVFDKSRFPYYVIVLNHLKNKYMYFYNKIVQPLCWRGKHCDITFCGYFWNVK